MATRTTKKRKSTGAKARKAGARPAAARKKKTGAKKSGAKKKSGAGKGKAVGRKSAAKKAAPRGAAGAAARARTERPAQGAGVPSGWPFAATPDTAVITIKRILMGESPILLVMRDENNGYWQFLDGQDVEDHEAAVVPFGELVEFDPTLAEVARLPEGWMASRTRVGGKWKQETQPFGIDD